MSWRLAEPLSSVSSGSLDQKRLSPFLEGPGCCGSLALQPRAFPIGSGTGQSESRFSHTTLRFLLPHIYEYIIIVVDVRKNFNVELDNTLVRFVESFLTTLSSLLTASTS